jgi:hypothetical protein
MANRTGTLPTGNFTLLPAPSGANFLKNQLLADPSFKQYYDHYRQQGFTFYPERVHLVTGASSVARVGVGAAYLLAIVPSFRKFKPDAESHDAVSIVCLQEGHARNIVAGHVTINHRPYRVSGFRLVTLVDGKLEEAQVDSARLGKGTPASIAGKLGLARALPADAETIGGPLDADQDAIAHAVYASLLNDKWAKPLYPPAGLKTMMQDSVLVQRFAQVARHSFSRAQTSARKLQGVCTSTSSSSNACSSTSSSVIFATSR